MTAARQVCDGWDVETLAGVMHLVSKPDAKTLDAQAAAFVKAASERAGAPVFVDPQAERIEALTVELAVVKAERIVLTIEKAVLIAAMTAADVAVPMDVKSIDVKPVGRVG